VYPQLLLARLFFSIGGAATSTMVTATLPTMTWNKTHTRSEEEDPRPGHQAHSASLSSEITVTPARLIAHGTTPSEVQTIASKTTRRATGQIAGLVGMFTGFGALIALVLFLPLPARLQKKGMTPANAVADSFYIVGAMAIVVGIFCFFGLKGLAGEEGKGWRNLLSRNHETSISSVPSQKGYIELLSESLRLCFTDASLGLGCLGGFVARASSVAISLFIPLFVNHYFISSGLCKDDPHSPPSDIKDQCRRAYTLAAALSGVSQLVALCCAPIFGYVENRFRRFNIPLMVAALAGIFGYVMFARLKSPDPKSEDGSATVFLVMALLGISQIGTIVCSLSLLGRGIQGGESGDTNTYSKSIIEISSQTDLSSSVPENMNESSSLLPSRITKRHTSPSSRNELKGSIAGWYSLAGGAGILLLTKLGGYLFDVRSSGAPFYMLAAFNAILLTVALACDIVTEVRGASPKGLP